MGTCKSCSGDGYMECPKCDGKGEISKLSITKILDVTEMGGVETKECSLCNGSGRKQCGACGGSGEN